MLSSLMHAVGFPLSSKWLRKRLPWWVQALVGLGGALFGSAMMKKGKTATDQGKKPHLLGLGSWNALQGLLTAFLAFRRRPRRLRA